MKIKVFELEFDASNLREVAFVKEVITGSNLSVPATAVTASETKEKPVAEKEMTPVDVLPKQVKPRKAKDPAPVEAATAKEASAPVEAATAKEASAPAEDATAKEASAPADAAPTAKEMQDLVISLIKSGTLSREDVQTIFNEFGGTSLMKIAPAKFALLKQRLTTYNS